MDYGFVVKEIEGDKVLLQDKEGQDFVWPKFKLPDNIEVGTELYFHISLNKVSPSGPKEILQEILNID